MLSPPSSRLSASLPYIWLGRLLPVPSIASGPGGRAGAAVEVVVAARADVRVVVVGYRQSEGVVDRGASITRGDFDLQLADVAVSRGAGESPCHRVERKPAGQ